MFGKRFSEYLVFQRWALAAVVLVGGARLTLSLGGVPHSTTRWLSMQVVWLAGFVYYAVAVQTRRFGGHRHILPLLVNQTVLVQGIAILGIGIAIVSGQDNVFTDPEHGRGAFRGATWKHAAGHLMSMPVYITLFWLLSWPVFAVSRRFASGRVQPAGGLASPATIAKPSIDSSGIPGQD